jgi:hypothetical protein
LFGFEDGLGPVVIGEFDLDGAVMKQFGGPSPEISSVSSKPSQAKPGNERPYSISRPAWISAAGDFASTMVADRDHRGTVEVEISLIPYAVSTIRSGRRVCSSRASSCRLGHEFGQPRQI